MFCGVCWGAVRVCACVRVCARLEDKHSRKDDAVQVSK